MIPLILTALLCALLAAPLPSPAPARAILAPEDFDAGGYTGAWMTDGALGVEYFLPDGWTASDSGAVSPDGAALAVSEAGTLEAGRGLADWAGEYTDLACEMTTVEGLEVALIRYGGRDFTVCVPCGGRVIAFAFNGMPDEALALRIAASCTDVW